MEHPVKNGEVHSLGRTKTLIFSRRLTSPLSKSSHRRHRNGLPAGLHHTEDCVRKMHPRWIQQYLYRIFSSPKFLFFSSPISDYLHPPGGLPASHSTPLPTLSLNVFPVLMITQSPDVEILRRHCDHRVPDVTAINAVLSGAPGLRPGLEDGRGRIKSAQHSRREQAGLTTPPSESCRDIWKNAGGWTSSCWQSNRIGHIGQWSSDVVASIPTAFQFSSNFSMTADSWGCPDSGPIRTSNLTGK